LRATGAVGRKAAIVPGCTGAAEAMDGRERPLTCRSAPRARPAPVGRKATSYRRRPGGYSRRSTRGRKHALRATGAVGRKAAIVPGCTGAAEAMDGRERPLTCRSAPRARPKPDGRKAAIVPGEGETGNRSRSWPGPCTGAAEAMDGRERPLTCRSAPRARPKPDGRQT